MGRTARKNSVTGFYHVIIRGIGRQILFEDRGDGKFFLKLLAKYSEETNITVMAYCLMENHVHILLHDDKDSRFIMMHNINGIYARYFNQKYDRVGHLFQDRYLSETIDNESGLLCVFRYIMNNPVKAGICSAEKYFWSSYNLYGRDDTFVDTSLLCSLIGTWEEYESFIKQKNRDECLDINQDVHDDNWALAVIRSVLEIENGLVLQSYDRSQRNKALVELKNQGLTVRQIERLTGISRGIVQRAR